MPKAFSHEGPLGVAILGATGSIGTTALRVIRRHSERFKVVALTAFENREKLTKIASDLRALGHPVSCIGVVNTNGDKSDLLQGREALIEAATHPDVDIVLNAVVGAAGLEATLAALRAGKRVALANKES